MVDLLGQHQKIRGEIDQAISTVINESRFINGRQVTSFKERLQEFLQIDHVIPCGNGTDALQLALMALDLPKNTEVIVPTFNYVAAAEAAALLGLKPVFCDVDESTFNVTRSTVEASITDNTKVIVVVHLYGQSADIQPIMDLAEKRDLIVIEDTAQALGADYIFDDGSSKKAGTIGHIGTTSFFPTKCLGAMGDGGAVFTRDEELANKMARLAFHGQTSKYRYGQVGFNSRLDTMQAAILEVKLGHLDEFIEIRRRVANFYNSHLSGIPGIETPYLPEYSTHVFHQYTLKIDHRENVMRKLEENEIPFVTYYPSPLHLEVAYHYLGYSKGDFAVSERLAEQALSLPMHTELEDDQLKYITDVMNNIN